MSLLLIFQSDSGPAPTPLTFTGPVRAVERYRIRSVERYDVRSLERYSVRSVEKS